MPTYIRFLDRFGNLHTISTKDVTVVTQSTVGPPPGEPGWLGTEQRHLVSVHYHYGPAGYYSSSFLFEFRGASGKIKADILVAQLTPDVQVMDLRFT